MENSEYQWSFGDGFSSTAQNPIHDFEEAGTYIAKLTVTDQNEKYHFDVTLNWSDYDLWCRGRLAPERVVDAIFRFLLGRESAGMILRKFDCSVVRRYFPQVDEELPKLL